MLRSNRLLLFLLACSFLSTTTAFPQDDTKPATKIDEDDSKSEKAQKKPGEDEPKEKPPEETKEQRRNRIRRHAVSGIGNFTNLVTIPQIQAHLNLSQKQMLDLNNQVKRTRIQIRKLYQDVQDLPKDKQSQRMAELRLESDRMYSESERTLRKVLTKEQLQIIDGISLQLRGPIALLDPEIIEKLELTEEQVEEIYQIVEKFEGKLAELRNRRIDASKPPKSLRGPRLGFTQLKDALEEDILAVLTDEQREKLEKLKGEEYKITPRRGPRGKPTPLDPEKQPGKQPQKSE